MSLSENMPSTPNVERDVVYARYGDRELAVDVFRPSVASAEPVPGILAIHGGADELVPYEQSVNDEAGVRPGGRPRRVHHSGRRATGDFLAKALNANP